MPFKTLRHSMHKLAEDGRGNKKPELEQGRKVDVDILIWEPGVKNNS